MDTLSRNLSAWLAWGLCALVVALTLLGSGLMLVDAGGRPNPTAWSDLLLYGPLAILFSVLAALLISRKPRNLIGWLMMLPAVALAPSTAINHYLGGFSQAPPVLTLPLWLLTWYAGWAWLPLIFAVMFIPLFFPTGRPPSARWWWVAAAMAIEAVIFLFMATFADQLTPVTVENVTWSVPNPIGFLPESQIEAWLAPWGLVLVGLVALCVASLLVRYRRAGAVVRTQIRWLLYACALFALVYVPAGFVPQETAAGERTLASQVLDLGFGLAMVAIPVAIAIAILRYRLWDIDLIIRRTLVYSALTALLALAYFGSVIVLQGVFRVLTGQAESPLVVVVSTLGIAALFIPLRARVQSAIDRRFYRRKYDAARTLAEFAASARDETDLEALTARLGHVVDQTMQPAHVSLWLKARPTQRG